MYLLIRPTVQTQKFFPNNIIFDGIANLVILMGFGLSLVNIRITMDQLSNEEKMSIPKFYKEVLRAEATKASYRDKTGAYIST